jgi:PAS domain S-box-containing protein
LIDSWNIGAERVFGYKESEIIGKKFDVLFTPEDRRKRVPQKELQTALKEKHAENERWHVRKDGSRFFASGMVTPLKIRSEGFVKITRDQTQKLEAEKARHQKEILQKLVQAQEAERKRIARDLHDDIGQQLVALRLHIEQIRQLCENNKELCARIDNLQTIAKRIDHGVDFLAWDSDQACWMI